MLMKTIVVSAQMPQSTNLAKIEPAAIGITCELISLVKNKGAATPQAKYHTTPEKVCAVSIALWGQLFMHRIQLSQDSFQ